MANDRRGSSFVALNPSSSPSQMMALARGVNKSLAGETSNTRKVTVDSGESSFTIQDPRCRAGRLAMVIPLDANGAGVGWYLSQMTKDSLTVTFTSALTDDASFGVVWLGDGQ